jgi:hypothetical protein
MHPTYTLSYKDKVVIKPSKLGLEKSDKKAMLYDLTFSKSAAEQKLLFDKNCY